MEVETLATEIQTGEQRCAGPLFVSRGRAEHDSAGGPSSWPSLLSLSELEPGRRTQPRYCSGLPRRRGAVIGEDRRSSATAGGFAARGFVGVGVFREPNDRVAGRRRRRVEVQGSACSGIRSCRPEPRSERRLLEGECVGDPTKLRNRFGADFLDAEHTRLPDVERPGASRTFRHVGVRRVPA